VFEYGHRRLRMRPERIREVYGFVMTSIGHDAHDG
jgi:hypothetical protein